MSDRRIVLLRHGRTEWNAKGRFQGQLDVDLDDVGRAQAERAAPILAQMRPSLIVASDLSRARETAGALADVTGLEVLTDPAFRETYSGQWEGLEREQIMAQFAASWAAWIDGDDLVRPGGDGELRGEVADRFVAGLTPYIDTLADGQTLVVVTHGGAARAAIARLMGLPENHWPSLGVLSNCAWSVLVERPQSTLWRLIEYNAGSLPEPPLSDDR